MVEETRVADPDPARSITLVKDPVPVKDPLNIFTCFRTEFDPHMKPTSIINSITSVVDPDPVGSEIICRIRIHNY